jgi:nucleoid-associated protein YgaU
MTTYTVAKAILANSSLTLPPGSEKSAASGRLAVAALVLAGGLHGPSAWAQNYPITPAQKSMADQVAQAGVPLSELSANAPDSYAVKSGDTLWGISGLFLKSPWRWPELWGMNRADIRNPHRIYPGQQLYLERNGGRATLRTSRTGAGGIETVKVSPRTRSQSLADDAIPTLKSQVIEPFLTEAIIVDEAGLTAAPRIVATQENRVLLSRGDRAYALGPAETQIVEGPGKLPDYRVFRNVTPLKDPVTGALLGYEAQYVGKAKLVRGESTEASTGKDGKPRTDVVPATIDIVSSKEEMRVGDRLLPEPQREITSYIPRAPGGIVDARIVSVYGSSVVNAAQNQVVVLNRGSKDGIESGHVLAILKDGGRVVDKTDPARPEIKLPNERNGLLMVFRTFDKLSYGLILDITDGVRVGDRLVNPL